MLAFATAMLLQGAAYASQPCAAPLCDADRLAPYFAKLGAARSGGAPVHVVFIGDSHTAGDQITGSWRTLLQTQYGSAGRGVLPPGRPYAGYLTRGITASQSSGWTVSGEFGHDWNPNGPPLGLSGYDLTSTQPSASISLVADPEETFNLFTVCALREAGAGTMTLSAGSAYQTISLDIPGSGAVSPYCTTIASGTPTLNASVNVAGGPVTITSWATASSGHGGVILSNLGTVGAQLVHFARTDDRVVAAELERYRPDLIVVAFGTNEAFGGDFSAPEFEGTLRGQIARLRRFSPGTPILLIGAPDSGTRRAELIGNAYGSAGMCPGLPTQSAEAPSDYAGEPRPGTVEQLPAPGSGWSPTRALPIIQSIQRRVAHQLGVAFWDWSQRMGGRCTASIWANLDPPLMRGDHVHFTTPGAAEIARRLQADMGAAATATASSRPSDTGVYTVQITN